MSELSVRTSEDTCQQDLDLFIEDEKELDLRWQNVRSYLERSRNRPRGTSGAVGYGLVTLNGSPDGRKGMWTVYFWEELAETQTPHGDVVQKRSVHAEVNRHDGPGVIEPEAVFGRPAWVTRLTPDGVSEAVDNRRFLESIPSELLADDQQNWNEWLALVEDRVAFDKSQAAA